MFANIKIIVEETADTMQYVQYAFKTKAWMYTKYIEATKPIKAKGTISFGVTFWPSLIFSSISVEIIIM